MIMHLWQRYISTALVPLAGTSVTVRREMGVFNNHVSVRIEGKVNMIVQRTTDAIVSYLSVLLSKQKKADFRPKNDELAFSRLNTEPCLLACDFLAKVREAAVNALSGRNAEIFLTEVGVTFHTFVNVSNAAHEVLADPSHLQPSPRTPEEVPCLGNGRPDAHQVRLQLSACGVLADNRAARRDLALYQDTISAFSLPALNDRFEMLRQLGNVFIVQPDILRSYLNEAYLARIENRLLRPFVMMRSDYGDYSRRFWDEVFGPDGVQGADGAAGQVGGSAAGQGGATGGAMGGAVSALGKIPGLSSLGNFSSGFASSAGGSGAANGSATGGGGPSSAGFIASSFGSHFTSSSSPHLSSSSTFQTSAAQSSASQPAYDPSHPPAPPPRPSSSASFTHPSAVSHSSAAQSNSANRKQSLFGTLMRDFEGLGLRDDAASGGYASDSAGRSARE